MKWNLYEILLPLQLMTIKIDDIIWKIDDVQYTVQWK